MGFFPSSINVYKIYEELGNIKERNRWLKLSKFIAAYSGKNTTFRQQEVNFRKYISNEISKGNHDLVTKLASIGMVASQIELGMFYSKLKNNKESERWLSLAANQNNAEAQSLFGDVLKQKKDYKKAIDSYVDSVNNGYFESILKLENIYVELKNYENARKWRKLREKINKSPVKQALGVAVFSKESQKRKNIQHDINGLLGPAIKSNENNQVVY